MARPMRVALIRHPRPLVAPGTCYGRLDIPEHPDAVAQIEASIQALRSFAPAILWSSPALRCQGMAAALSTLFGGAMHHDSRLLEIDFGAWEGLPWDDVPRDALDRWARDPLGFAAPGGESAQALIARVTEFHNEIMGHARDCVIVTHGGPLKILRALRAGTAIDLMAPTMALGAIEIT